MIDSVLGGASGMRQSAAAAAAAAVAAESNANIT